MAGRTKSVQIDIAILGFYFFLQAIKYDDLPNNIKKIIKMSNIPDIKDEYSVEYYIGISDNIKINDCYVEEYYLILRWIDEVHINNKIQLNIWFTSKYWQVWVKECYNCISWDISSVTAQKRNPPA